MVASELVYLLETGSATLHQASAASSLSSFRFLIREELFRVLSADCFVFCCFSRCCFKYQFVLRSFSFKLLPSFFFVCVCDTINFYITFPVAASFILLILMFIFYLFICQLYCGLCSLISPSLASWEQETCSASLGTLSS